MGLVYEERFTQTKWTIGWKWKYCRFDILGPAAFEFTRFYGPFSDSVAYSDSSVIDIRISMLPGLHGQLANVQPIITTVSPSPSTTGQPPSFPTSHGCCPSPGCPCGHMQQFLLHTLFAAQQTLAGLYPLSSEQDAQMSAECRGTIRECRKTLQWLAEGGVHVHQVLQACVLLRATCKDVEALDRLLKWLKDGTLQWKLKRAYKVSGDPQSTSSFLVKINPNQYLLCRENIGKSVSCTSKPA